MHSYTTFMEKEKQNFEDWKKVNKIVKYKKQYFIGSGLNSWTKEQLLKIYNYEIHQP